MYEEVGEVFVCFTMKYYEEGGPVLRQFPLAVARRRKKPFFDAFAARGISIPTLFLSADQFPHLLSVVDQKRLDKSVLSREAANGAVGTCQR